MPHGLPGRAAAGGVLACRRWAHTLLGTIQALVTWTEEHQAEIALARAEFDAAQESRAAGARPCPSPSYRDPMGGRDTEALLQLIRDSVIGDDLLMETPYGVRRVTYADYTASGRALTFIEDFIRDQVLPGYANTHTESSGTGLQTTRLREEARRDHPRRRSAAATTPS